MSWLCALWKRHEGTRGRRLLPACWASRVERSPATDGPSLGRAARSGYPLAVGAGRVGVWTRNQPHSARSWELALRAVGAVRGRRGGGGGAFACMWGTRGWALSHARPPFFEACGRDALPTAVGAEVVGVETCHQPHSARSCKLALPAAEAREGARGGAPVACVWGVWGLALSHARPRVLGACRRGPLPTGCGCGGCGREDPSPTPQHVLLRAGFARCVGGTRARPGRGVSSLSVGLRGRAPSPSRPPIPGACGRGPLPTGFGGRGYGRGDPS